MPVSVAAWLNMRRIFLHFQVTAVFSCKDKSTRLEAKLGSCKYNSCMHLPCLYSN